MNIAKKKNIPSIDNNGEICISLLNCFEIYIQPSYSTNDNKKYCSSCEKQTYGLYCNFIYSLSPTIIISLNRGKNNIFKCKVDFPEILNLQNYVNCPLSNTNYKLKSVITHLGLSGISGHFIAYCRHRINNIWYFYNDSSVTYCNDQNNDFIKGTPYILFYESTQGNNNILFDEVENNYNINNFNLMKNMNIMVQPN